MIALLRRLWRQPTRSPARADDSGFYATRFVGRQAETQLFVHWAQRAPDLAAVKLEPAVGVPLLTKLLGGTDRGIPAFDAEQLTMLAGYLDYARVDSGKQVIGQDEQGDFLMIVLDGVLAEARTQPTGGRTRLSEAHPGDLLGDLTALDTEARVSSWTTLTPATVAVITSTAMDHMMQEDPWLAAELLAWMGKRVSLRLRQANARLSAQLTRQ